MGATAVTPKTARPPLYQANADARLRTNQFAMTVRGPSPSTAVRVAPIPIPSSR